MYCYYVLYQCYLCLVAETTKTSKSRLSQVEYRAQNKSDPSPQLNTKQINEIKPVKTQLAEFSFHMENICDIVRLILVNLS